VVIRENLRRIRQAKGQRREDIAIQARSLGLRWDAATVAGIELGRRHISAGELLLLPTILDVELAELIEAARSVDFDGAVITEHGLRLMARGRQLDAATQVLSLFAKVEASATDAERKAARKLGLGVLDLIALAQRAWNRRRLDEEREKRLALTRGRGEIARRRAHVTRALTSELRELLESERDAAANAARATHPEGEKE